jgi:hypothetical protein
MILCLSLAKKPIRETAVFTLENGYEKDRKERKAYLACLSPFLTAGWKLVRRLRLAYVY